MKKILTTLLTLGLLLGYQPVFADDLATFTAKELINETEDFMSVNYNNSSHKNEDYKKIQDLYEEFKVRVPAYKVELYNANAYKNDIKIWLKDYKKWLEDRGYYVIKRPQSLKPVSVTPVKGVTVKNPSNEVELVSDKRTQAISMIMALKASGEPITIAKLLPIIMLLRS